jgi:site-specific DNA recombinase
MSFGSAGKLATEQQAVAPATVRCAIYTRKSTEEGLHQDFNSLDAQREAAEAYIASQKGSGWMALPTSYDDGGYTGGNMDRPALKQLVEDVKAGAVDCVLVYKVDRLSRSLTDFARIVEVFESHSVSIVSVTQQFNTTNSLGRLTLNILLSFAQFERELIAERTRDKVTAARRKGKWIGGHLLLGYDLDPGGGRLVVNLGEADQVREIFRLYQRERSLTAVVRTVYERGWRSKRWISRRKGRERGGRPFTKASLFKLLTNPAYCGKVQFGGVMYDGEHEGIVDSATWDDVQRTLKHNGRTGGSGVRNRYGAMLKGLLRCAHCGGSMVHTYTSRNSRRYRYYVCLIAQQRGWDVCKTKSVSAPVIEAAVLKQVKFRVTETGVLRQVLLQIHAGEEDRPSDIDGVWESLRTKERVAFIAAIVERVDYNGASCEVAITFDCQTDGTCHSTDDQMERRSGVEIRFTLEQLSRRRDVESVQRKPIPVSRTTRLMALAIKLQGQLERGEVEDHAEIARALQLTRARVSQIMNLLNLAPEIQEQLIFAGDTGTRIPSEQRLRPVTREIDWAKQRELWDGLLGEICSKERSSRTSPS